MPRVKSVIAIGVGGQTQGAWRVPAKAMAYFGSTETRAYSCSYALAFFIERRFQVPSIYCPPDLDNEEGPRIPLQSLKLHAELAGLGARSLAGDILLHPEFGYMYFASVFTELELPPDEPLAENPCPAPSCVDMYRRLGQTPCMKFCPVQCLSGTIDADGRQSEMRYDMAACAEMSQQYEAVPAILAEAMEAGDEVRRRDALFDPDHKMLWYKMSVGSGGPPRPVLRVHAGVPDRDRGGARGPHPPGPGPSRDRERPMTQGLTRAQLGVTDEMVTAYGETVFALSNNLQTRRGDPVREKDFDGDRGAPPRARHGGRRDRGADRAHPPPR